MSKLLENPIDLIAVIIAAVVGGAAWLYAKRSAASSHVSATNSHVSAVAAQDSATSAKESARHAETMAKVGTSQEHDRLRPLQDVDKLQAQDGKGDNRRWLEASIALDKPYRARATAVLSETSTAPLNLYGLLQPGKTYTIMIEDLPPGRDEGKVQEIIIDFWPPAAIDPVEHWTCPCGRSTDETTGPGHWQRRIAIGPPSRPFARFV